MSYGARAERATLLFVVRSEEVLLMRKKRGLGAGKITGPGGRVEDGETPRAAAEREIHEELGVVAIDVRACGALDFTFADGYALWVDVFSAADHHGEPRESDEGSPMWRRIDDMPWDEMWADDPIWMPHMFAGTPFLGTFAFDGDRILRHELTLGDEAVVAGLQR